MMTVRNERLANLKALAGDEIDELLRSKEFAIRSLENPNHRMRAAAVSVLSVDFGMDDECVAALLSVADDSDSDVRTAARLALAHRYCSPPSEQARSLYRSVILDEEVDTFTRFDTYIKLLRLDGATPERLSDLLIELQEPSLAKINWEDVNRGTLSDDQN